MAKVASMFLMRRQKCLTCLCNCSPKLMPLNRGISMRLSSNNLHQNIQVHHSLFVNTPRRNHNNILSNIKRCMSMYVNKKRTSNCHLKYLLNNYKARTHASNSVDILTLKNQQLVNYIDDQVAQYEDALNCRLDAVNQPDKTLKEATVVINKLGQLFKVYTEYLTMKAELDELNKILTEEKDEEMQEIAKDEIAILLEQMEEQEASIIHILVPEELGDDKNVVLEVSAGVGGVEAMLFAGEIFKMYTNYAQYRGWSFELQDLEYTDSVSKSSNALRKASAIVGGQSVYKYLKYEGGVHRVQRIPKTEKGGRIHTSTMTVAILPQATEIDVFISPNDLEITCCRASGAGGQHVNTTDSAVRIIHKPTGLAVESQKCRSQIQNKETALNILRTKLYEAELEKQSTDIRNRRKLQVGARGRSEKIRTYNFGQDRITDHRVSGSLFNLDKFLSGGEALDRLVDDLQLEAKKERLVELLETWQAKKKK